MHIDPKKSLFLIDGSAFLYRAYYGLRPLHTSQGVAVQAVYSFCRMIKKLIDTFGAEYVAIVWDSKGKTTRHQMYEQYKATRQAPPSDLFEQKKYIEQFAQLVGIKQLAQPGIEADDLMYSIAKEQEKAMEHIIFVTADKDMAQALSDSIIIFDPLKNEFIHKDTFEALLGYPTTKLPFYYALLGDASDNIPGVPGIGKKTATDIVKKFDSLEDLYTRLDQAPTPRMARILAEHKENAFLSRDLFLLQYHPTGTTVEDFNFNPANWRNAIPLFEDLQFHSLLKDVGQTKQEQWSSVDAKIEYWKQQNFVCVTDEPTLQTVCDQIKETGYCAIDTETSGPNHALSMELVGISICMDPATSYYIPCAHTTGTQLSLDYIKTQLKPLFEEIAIKKYMHNAKYDLLVLENHELPVQGLVLDTMIAARLVLPETQKVGLKYLSLFYFNENMLFFNEVIKSNKYTSFKQVPLDLATWYAAADARQTLKLAHILEPALIKDSLYQLYQTIEHPLIYILTRMEKEGIKIDMGILALLDVDVMGAITAIEEKIKALIDGDQSHLNLNSPKQVEQLLFYTLQLPPQKKSSKGTAYSTDHEVLTALAQIHPIPALIIKYRELTKLKSTYIDALPHFINATSGKIHTSFNQIGTATGRLASSDPNLQNIPASGYGIEIRQAFKPTEGHLFLSADYSQIELRVLAYLAQEQNLINAFLAGKDIHTQTSALLFNVALESVTHEQRQMGKRINFSVLYGLTPYGLSRELNISFKEAKQYIDRYFEQYPAIAAWMESIIATTKKQGYVQTHWKRRRYVPAIYEKNRVLYEEACRIAVNTVVQGTAAEIMKQGMIQLDAHLASYYPGAHILLQIHDELLLTVPHTDIAIIQPVVKTILEGVTPDWNVPLEITTRIGHSWKEVTK